MLTIKKTHRKSAWFIFDAAGSKVTRKKFNTANEAEQWIYTFKPRQYGNGEFRTEFMPCPSDRKTQSTGETTNA